jgi:hypothetical protein
MLQYNKLYQSLKKVSAEWHSGHVQWGYYWDFLKFYKDGKVISCNNSNNDIQKINSWFSIENNDAYFNRGIYTIKDNKISITISVAVGQLVYEGEIQNDGIVLHVQNTVTKYSNWDFFINT